MSLSPKNNGPLRIGPREMSVKSRTKLAAIVTASLAFGAFAPAMAAEKPLLVFVPNGPSDFWQAAVAGMKKAQAELPGFKLELEYPQQATVAAQQQLMEDLVTAGARGIMVSAVDPKTSTTGLNKIASETTLFTTDSDAPQTNRVVYIGSSNIDAGLQAAEIAKKAMPNGGKCMGFVGLLGADNARERIEGFKQGLAGTKISLVDVRGDDLDQTRAKENVSDVLVADPQVTCMVGFYSYNTPQIYAALKEAGELGKIVDQLAQATRGRADADEPALDFFRGIGFPRERAFEHRAERLDLP